MPLSLNNEMTCTKEYIYIYAYHIKVAYICASVKRYRRSKIPNTSLSIV